MVRIRNVWGPAAGTDAAPGVEGAGDSDMPGVCIVAGIDTWWRVDDRKGRYKEPVINDSGISGNGGGGGGASLSYLYQILLPRVS